jgi:hypothetical protein
MDPFGSLPNVSGMVRVGTHTGNTEESEQFVYVPSSIVIN